MEEIRLGGGTYSTATATLDAHGGHSSSICHVTGGNFRKQFTSECVHIVDPIDDSVVSCPGIAPKIKSTG